MERVHENTHDLLAVVLPPIAELCTKWVCLDHLITTDVFPSGALSSKT